MKIILNDKKININSDMTLFRLIEVYKSDADIIIYNGYSIKKDIFLKENDNVFLLKKGEIPKQEEFEYSLVSRHTPVVHKKLKKSIVGIAGLGGLGSNLAILLARSGIGKLILVDFDIIEPSNLNRQQYFIRHLGMKKTMALKEIINDINPYVEIEIVDLFLNESNIEETFFDVDIIVEAFDDPISKAILINKILLDMPDKYIIAASGVAGYFSNNTIKTKKISDKFYLIGDDCSEAKPGCGLMAPRVSIAAAHQANTVVRIIMGELEV